MFIYTFVSFSVVSFQIPSCNFKRNWNADNLDAFSFNSLVWTNLKIHDQKPTKLTKSTFFAKGRLRTQKSILTDVIVAFSLTKLLPKREGSKALELFRELLRSVRCKRVVALPAHLVIWLELAGIVVFTLHHVEHVALRVHQRHLALRVMRTDDVQVVVELHLHCVVVLFEPAEMRQGQEGCTSSRRPITVVIASELWQI